MQSLLLNRSSIYLVVAGLACLVAPVRAQTSPDAPTPEQRAVAFLAREVPAWPAEHKCFSCHNNGDAARALYAAKRQGFELADDVLAATTDWAAHPERWDDNKGDPEFSDKTLADIQFAAALVSAHQTGAVKEKAPLVAAAERIVSQQQDDGSWKIAALGALGAPATYGPTLATMMALRTLRAAEKERFTAAIARGEAWLVAQRPKSTLDASALLLGINEMQSQSTDEARRHALQILREGQSSSGSWGPYKGFPTEVFDTAIAVLALSSQRDAPGAGALIAKGRAYLIAEQRPEGDWPETTRPTGFDSYAQRLSTAGWATLALLESGAKKADQDAP